MEARLIGLAEGDARLVRAAPGRGLRRAQSGAAAAGEPRAPGRARRRRRRLSGRRRGQLPDARRAGRFAGVVREVDERGAAVRLQPSARRTPVTSKSHADRSAVSVEEVVLAKPRGFCAGVDRAIEIVERALAQLRRADLRAPRDRPQHLRRRRPEGEGRDLRRRPGRGAARRHADLQRARRVAGGAPRGGRRAASACSTRPARS